MWKSHFNVDAKGIIIHSPCANRCGNLQKIVENLSSYQVFHFSTEGNLLYPVEMWKT
jgi:hypothetical protein